MDDTQCGKYKKEDECNQKIECTWDKKVSICLNNPFAFYDILSLDYYTIDSYLNEDPDNNCVLIKTENGRKTIAAVDIYEQVAKILLDPSEWVYMCTGRMIFIKMEILILGSIRAKLNM
jgi:hypothetical protein